MHPQHPQYQTDFHPKEASYHLNGLMPSPPSVGHPLSSESGKCIQKWILYQAIQDPSDFLIYWDPTDPDDIRLLQEYVESNGFVVYLPSSTVKSLICLWNYIYLLIKKERPVDQKCNVLYFLQDDQWFNLTAHDMKRTLVNAGMEYHKPQIIPGTSLPNSTSPPSPAPMRSPIHLELTPCDSTSTTTSKNKMCLLNTSCDHQLHLDHPSTSPELQDHTIVGSANLSLFLILKTYFSWILSVSHLKPHATLKLNFFLNSMDNWMTPTYHQQMFSLGTMTMNCSYCKKRLMHHIIISIIMTYMALKSKIKMSLTEIQGEHFKEPC